MDEPHFELCPADMNLDIVYVDNRFHRRGGSELRLNCIADTRQFERLCRGA